MPILLQFADMKYSDASVLGLSKSMCISTPSEAEVELLFKPGKICILLDDETLLTIKNVADARVRQTVSKIRYVRSSTKSTPLHMARMLSQKCQSISSLLKFVSSVAATCENL